MKDEKIKELNNENLEEVNGGMSVTEVRYSLTDDEIIKLIDKGYIVKSPGGIRGKGKPYAKEFNVTKDGKIVEQLELGIALL